MEGISGNVQCVENDFVKHSPCRKDPVMSRKNFVKKKRDTKVN